MYILATTQPEFCSALQHRSLPSTAHRDLIWKLPYPNNLVHWKYVPVHDKIQGSMNAPQVCHQDGNFEHDDVEKDKPDPLSKRKVEESIEYIKTLLISLIDDGQISVSPYDTAWVALIKDFRGHNNPQFPSTLEWIANNQLLDGSWGDEQFFLVEDRLVNTLACVVALKSWSRHADKAEKGILFIKENINKLEEGTEKYITCGFELVFPVLLQRAMDLGIDGLPYNASVVKEICVARDQKLERSPIKLVDKVSTCLLYCLEGLKNLEWSKLKKLQTPNGSFLTSPAATSFAAMETKDEKCFQFIEHIVNKFNGGVPTAYPVDIFARLWVVDCLQRLGISRFFRPEIRDCLDHVHRVWTDKGLFIARESEFCDLDSTSMGFRLLRLHGYNVSPNALSNLKKGNEFTCYVGQEIESPSSIYNLYRASQVLFPGETLLEEARQFSTTLLHQKLEEDQLVDKRLISKHLSDEIRHGLGMPWYACLPHVEARFYLQHYGVDDILIGKTLFRMVGINNVAYLELAKFDYNQCQAKHQMEWKHVEQWYEHYSLEEFGISKRDILIIYFLASATIFEPERSEERLAWVKSQIVSNILLTYYLIKEDEPSEHSIEFSTRSRKHSHIGQDKKGYKNVQRIITILFEMLSQQVKDVQERIGKDVSELLHEAWGGWLKKLGEGIEEKEEAELLTRIVNICGGRIVSKETLFHDEYKTISALINTICYKLNRLGNKKTTNKAQEKANDGSSKYKEIEKDMQLLVQLVLQGSSNDVARDVKELFLLVAKTFHYMAHFATNDIDEHVSKVLFEHVV